MSKPIDTAYYATRIAQERARAAQASDPVVRRVHSDLADRYERLVAAPAD